VVIVDIDGEGSDAPGLAVLAAINKSHELDINPGPKYSVQGKEMQKEIPEEFKNRLLGRGDIDELQGRINRLKN
jgi:hypothetical protein